MIDESLKEKHELLCTYESWKITLNFVKTTQSTILVLYMLYTLNRMILIFFPNVGIYLGIHKFSSFIL